MKRKFNRDQIDESSEEDLYNSKSQNEKNEENVLICEICLKRFNNIALLKRHMASHMARRKCELCDKSFARIDNLRVHQKKIHGMYLEKKQKPSLFTCEICDKTFGKKYYLTRHQANVHQRVTPRHGRTTFSCRHCDSEFREYNDLFHHINREHPLNQHGGERTTTPVNLNANENVQKKNENQVNGIGDNNDENTRQSTDESALKNGVLNRYIHPKSSEKYDVLTFFGNIREQVRTFLESRVNAIGGIKWNLCVQIEMQRDDGQEITVVTPFFRSLTYFTLMSDDFNDHDLNEAMQKMFASLEKFIREGSGWYVRKVLKLEIHTVVYKPVSGSTYMPLPKSLALSRSLLNIQNRDNKCFLYCVLASMRQSTSNPELVENYLQYEHDVNMSGVTYPVTLPQIRKVENQNENISINVFTYESETILPVRITEQRHRIHHVNLLWLTSGDLSHYYLITNLNRFLNRTKTCNDQMHFCPYCLHGFCEEYMLRTHQQQCSRHGAQRVELPIPDQNDTLEFKDYEKTQKVKAVIYADTETINRKLHTCAPNPEHSATTPTTKLEVCGFAYKVVFEDNRYTMPTVIYRGADASKKLIECLLREQEKIEEIISVIEPMNVTAEHDDLIENATHCCICKKQFTTYDKTYGRIVRHHNHFSGEIIGPACNNCNLSCKQAKFIPVIFHNLKNFDAHILCESLGLFKEHRLSCIAQNSERYVSFSLGRLRFIDSFQFLPGSLECLVENLAQDGLKAFPHLLSECDSEQEAKLLLRKGIYPYDYMDSFDKFDEGELPPKDMFYSIIKKEHISDEDYGHAKRVFQTFNMTSLGQYHDLYLKMDTVLLAQVFESFRALCMEQYELDPCHFYTSPGLSWSACLKMTGVKLTLLTDIDKVLMVENGIRGGVSQISNRYQKANNSYLPDFDSSQAPTYLQYLDANNLYGWSMIQPLPVDGFVFMNDREIQNFDVMSASETGETGYILEVSLEYPKTIHDSHNSLPLAPIRKTISNEELSPYAQRLLVKMRGLSDEDPLPNRGKTEKLLTTLEDKDRYVLHYRNLQLYLRLGMKLKSVHRVLKFRQKAWMRPYIDLNTEMRKKATSTFQKNFYKLLNVSVFGKTMENVRLHKDIELVHTEKRLKKVSAKATYKNSVIFNENLIAAELYKAKVNLFKPIYCGMAILDLSKYLMYDFWYNFIKKRYENPVLHMTDTDSILFSTSDDIYKSMESSLDYFDTSDFPSEHALHSDRNKKVLGKMKDETNGNPISEFIGLRSKMYSFLCNNKEEKRLKGISKVTVKKELKHEHYKNALFNETSKISSMSSLRSHKHEIFGETIQKTGLSAFDDKRYLINAVESYAYGHYKIRENCNKECDNSNIECDNDNVSENCVETEFSVIPIEDLTECHINWTTLDEQMFILDDYKIVPCLKM